MSLDHWFLDRICAHVLAFEADAQVRLFRGNWSDCELITKERYGKDIQPHRVKYRTLK